MKNFQPGGLRNRREDIGGRPRGDVNQYAPKTRTNDRKPGFSRSEGHGKFGNKDRAPREVKSYPATCTDCGKSCDVPFRPDGVKPVLCRDCYSKKSDSTSFSSNPRDRFTSSASRDNRPAVQSAPHGVSKADYELVLKQLAVVEEKVTQILALINASEKLIVELPPLQVTAEHKEETNVAQKPALAKKVAAKKVAAKKVVVKKAAKKVVKK